MSPIENLTTLVNSDRDGLTGEQLLNMQRQIAGERFYLATIVAQRKRAYLQMELARKSLVIQVKLRAKAEYAKTPGPGKALSETAANDIAEENWQVREARAAEINAEIDFEEARLILSTSEGVLTSLVMRISDLKSERFHSAKVTHA